MILSILDAHHPHALGRRVRLGVVSQDHLRLHSMNDRISMDRQDPDRRLDDLYLPPLYSRELDHQQVASVMMPAFRYPSTKARRICKLVKA